MGLLSELRSGILMMIGYGLAFSGVAQDADLPPHFQNYAATYPNDVIMKGEGTDKTLALTFDDGPTELTKDILDLLSKYKTKATFFWQGSQLVQKPEMVHRANEAGHELANHSWDHPNGVELDPYQLWKSQVVPTIGQYQSLTDKDLMLYRPPYGGITETQIEFLKHQGIITVLWSHSTMDWDSEKNSCKSMYERFRDGLHPGAIVLMHDMDFDDSATEKLCAIQKIIEYATDQGYAFQTVSEMMQTSY